MSTTPSAHPSPPPAAPAAQREIRIYSHSALFYWWPVWFVGFLMGLITMIDGHRMLLVPAHTTVEAYKREGGQDVDDKVLLIPPANAKSFLRDDEGKLIQPKVLMAQTKELGVIFLTVLLIIIVISNVPLRGLWSVVIIFMILFLVLLISLWHQWERIFEWAGLLRIHINEGGYFFISLVLFIIWAVTVFIFDHRTYVIITSGQVRVCLAVGAGETVYDTTGMTFEKRQDDLFRHWIVGLGSGDLLIHRTQTNADIPMHNVLFIGAKIREVERLMKEREVV
jgi:hypothetical protein